MLRRQGHWRRGLVVALCAVAASFAALQSAGPATSEPLPNSTATPTAFSPPTILRRVAAHFSELTPAAISWTNSTRGFAVATLTGDVIDSDRDRPVVVVTATGAFISPRGGPAGAEPPKGNYLTIVMDSDGNVWDVSISPAPLRIQSLGPVVLESQG